MITSCKRNKGRKASPPIDLQLRNGFSAVQSEEEVSVASGEAAVLFDPVPCENIQKK